MKVTRDTPQQLVVEDTPWFIAIMLVFFILAFVGPALLMVMDGVWEALFFGLFGGGLGLIAFAVFVRRVQVILDAPGNAVTVRRRSLFGYSQVRHDLSNLDGARLDQIPGKNGRAMYRPTLLLSGGMSAGPHPIVQSYTNGRGPGRVVEAINDWLAANRAAGLATNP